MKTKQSKSIAWVLTAILGVILINIRGTLNETIITSSIIDPPIISICN